MDVYHTVINMHSTTPLEAEDGMSLPVTFPSDYGQWKPTSDDESKMPLPSGIDLRPMLHAEEKNLVLQKEVYRLVKSSKDLSQMDELWPLIQPLIDQKSPKGNSILHIAARLGNDKVIEILTESQKGPHLVHSKNVNDDNPLHVAIKAGNFRMLKMLFRGYFQWLDDEQMRDRLDHTRNFLRSQNKQGNTILHEALIHNYKQDNQDEIIRLFEEITIPKEEKDEKELSVHAFEDATQIINKDDKSVLYLAIEMGCYQVVSWILCRRGEDNKDSIPKGKSPLLAAIVNPKHQEMLEIILEKNRDWIHLRDKDGRIALHWAASVGNLDAVRCLLKQCSTCSIESDKNGLYALHLASEGGQLEVLKELLIHCLDPEEIADNNGRNILHVAAARGRLNVVKYILRHPSLEEMINEMDADGNTPLHLATLQNRPKVVYALTWDKRVCLDEMNSRKQTALDVNKEQADRENQSLRQRLVWIALKSAGATRSHIKILPLNPDTQSSAEKRKSDDKSSEETHKKDKKIPEEEVKQEKNSESKKGPDMERFKDRIETLIVVSTLIITATFTGGFTLPGGNADDNHGFPYMINRTMFHLYIYCITISMYGAISVTIILIWARLGDVILLSLAVKFAGPLLGITIGTLSLAFLCGVFLVISPVGWLASSFLVIAVICLIMVLSVYTLLWLPSPSKIQIFRYISYYPFLGMAHVAEDDSDRKGSRHKALGIM